MDKSKDIVAKDTSFCAKLWNVLCCRKRREDKNQKLEMEFENNDLEA